MGAAFVNKAELIDRVARKTLLTKHQSEQVLDAALDVITKAVSRGDDVKIVGFGTFCRTLRKARPGRNPKTGMTLTIPSQKVPKFKPGKDFRDSVK
jgi:DNA-binding protein HU-beta